MNISAEEEQIKQFCNNIFELGLENIDLKDEDVFKATVGALSYNCRRLENDKSLVALQQICTDERVDIKKRVFIFWQLVIMKFKNNICNEEKLDLEYVYKAIFESVKAKVDSLERIELEDRNRNIVVLMTNQFLGYQHSPTKVLLSIAKAIETIDDEVDEIHIFNTNELPNTIECLFEGSTPSAFLDNTDEQLQGTYQDAQLSRCKIVYKQNGKGPFRIENLKDMTKTIYNLKPKYAISVGGTCLLADICNEFLDVYTFSLSNDLPIANTKYLAVGGSVTEVKEYKYNEKQNALEIPFLFEIVKEDKNYTYPREQLGFAENQFIIAVVGNRLENEINHKFLDLCINLLESNQDAGIALVGKYNKELLEDKVPKEILDRFYLLGYKSDLLALLRSTNLYLNPIRQGGGLSAVAAMSISLPVISTSYGDVGKYLNRDFIIADYDEALTVITHMIDDKRFYEYKCRKMKSWYSRFSGNSLEKFINYINNKS
ncbi:glycosyltransferase family 4 protein [Clostridium cellulovorans]|uniref:Glycosyl transferase group 1 n=2 Tax=Clostridium cellulovorans TaxID=1493 RepID=D9SNG8_CLOC7|nr:glycosyltransferase family 4 protein [Clostridium cellulovorans]ADL53960.1 glycosyl transferase group 1 [Clostridium cellulovorans 743B]BAV13182.1 glycosyl transferase [Clostridium cellulovorans]